MLFLLPLLGTGRVGLYAQLDSEDKAQFTRQDSLRGSITPERSWWDLTYYDLTVDFDLERRSLKGSNLMTFRVLRPGQRMQIDLQQPLELSTVRLGKKPCVLTREGNVYFVKLPEALAAGSVHTLIMEYYGKPREAKRAPWDGGISWALDRSGQPFVATSCQGLGASVWWPNKDHMYDEPDSMRIHAYAPKDLVAVSNGRLEGVEDTPDGRRLYHWAVRNPINNYGVNLNIGDYVRIDDMYRGLKGTLDLSYYVLKDNEARARSQFSQVPKMLEAFEYWFGPYPFYTDGFKIVEVPYLGMEHQSSVTYGNGYQNGYLGQDLSGTGQGMKFDFIIIHESGHEWFANNITYQDTADMWIHESFTSYSEALYLEYHFGFEAAQEYVVGIRKNILNDRPIIGPYGVNREGSTDMYFKGSNMLHTLRMLVEDDELWRSILIGLNRDFYHQTVTSRQIEDYLSEKTGKDLSAFFNQYLRTANIPTLQYRLLNGRLHYRYRGVVKDFDMPVQLIADGEEMWIFPNSNWKASKDRIEDVGIHPGFLINFERVE